MKQYLLLIIFLSCTFFGYGQQTKQLKSIDKYIQKVIKINEIPGLAVGIVKDDKILFEKYYGIENLENFQKVNERSMFRVYSTTKLISNVAVFQLVEKGRLSLDDKISKYLDNLPSAWQNVQVKNLLSHSSGIPDFANINDNFLPSASNREVIDLLSKGKMEFETGNEYRYNQTNYLLLAMIIEEITGQTFEEFALKNQFYDSKKQIVFSSNSLEKIPNRVQKYTFDDKTKVFKKDLADLGKRSIPANGLAITLPAFLEWTIHLSKNDFLNSDTKKIMWKPFDYKNKSYVFGHGWEISIVNNNYSYGFSGGNVSVFKIFPDNNLAIILMYNGSNSSPVQYQIINHITGIINENLLDPYLYSEEEISTSNIIGANEKKEIYGYRIENGKIIFSYRLPEPLKTEQINSLSVVGSFNNWNPEDALYQMHAKNDSSFELVLPVDKFEKGKTYSFKFVMNNSGWLPTPNNALNLDGTTDNNLLFRVD